MAGRRLDGIDLEAAIITTRLDCSVLPARNQLGQADEETLYIHATYKHINAKSDTAGPSSGGADKRGENRLPPLPTFIISSA